MKIRILFYILLVVSTFEVSAQFYNGHQMQFGKNRVQYNSFYWTFYRFDRFDTYYSENGDKLAQYASDFAKKEIPRIESFFDYKLDKRIIFIVYNKLADFRQSNIGLVTGKNETNIGGTFEVNNNKAFLYFEGDFEKFEQQITAAISRLLINEMIFGMQLRNNAANSTLLNLPNWYIDGLVAFLSKDWDFETENRVKDGILSGKYRKFNRLEGEDAAYAGHSFWRYVSEVYGESAIPSILYLTKINKNANSGFFYVVGSSLKDLSAEWNYYYKDLYSEIEEGANLPTEEPLKKRPKKKSVYQNMAINPTGNYVAYVTNQMGKYKIWLYNTQTDKHKKILKREHKLEQITDFSYPVMAWHPSGRTLTFILEEKGGVVMYYYTFGERKMIKRNILYYDKVLSYSFAPDGSLIVLSAVKDGQTDIFVHNIAAGTNFQVTNDIADDFYPRFINGGKQIIFASDRSSDTLSVEMDKKRRSYTQDLYIYDYEKKTDKLLRLADDKYISKNKPYEVGTNQFISLSNKSGIINRYYSKFDSTISFVDTTVHFRYYAETSPLSNYKRNIIEHDFDGKSNQLGEMLFNKGKYYMYLRDFEIDHDLKDDLPKTQFREQETRKLAIADSLNSIVYVKVTIDSLLNNQIISGKDTVLIGVEKIDINNYIFELERIKMLNEQFKNDNIHIQVLRDDEVKEPQPRIYQLAFYQNYLVSQVDFSFLSESYQTFTGGAVYFNPNMNLAFKLGSQDLFENYKITAGLRLPLDFQSSEYLIGLEVLKDRLNKQFFFHRQTFNNQTQGDTPFQVKNITNEIHGVFRYPLSQVTSTSATIGLRQDRTIYQSVGSLNAVHEALTKPNIEKLWTTLKLEYVFDNTRSLGLNLPAGSRFKIFGEVYQMLNSPHNNLFVMGADFRNYIVIHRNLIWANRFAASSSGGNARLIYYLGGVDNWTNFSSRTPTFIPLSEIRITDNANYAFQTVATNMRGFSQNIRNGSNFALINSELRWPFIRYIANYPLSNAFLENLQLIGFFDIGTAWSGYSPWAKQNGYDRDFIYQGSFIEIEIDAQRDPVVAGYGFGVRSQLLGYFIRLDWAWGIENMQVLPRVFYFSLALDF
jgi:WD40 repeat protein